MELKAQITNKIISVHKNIKVALLRDENNNKRPDIWYYIIENMSKTVNLKRNLIYKLAEIIISWRKLKNVNTLVIQLATKRILQIARERKKIQGNWVNWRND